MLLTLFKNNAIFLIEQRISTEDIETKRTPIKVWDLSVAGGVGFEPQTKWRWHPHNPSFFGTA